MDNKIIFFDIDGTLLNHQGVVCQSTVRTLEQLKQNGHLRFICTGRTKCMLPKAITDIDFDGYVYGGGTHIEYKESVLEQFEIPEKVLKDTLGKLKKCGITYAVEGPQFVYVESEALTDARNYFRVFIKSLGENVKVIEPALKMKANKITCLFPKMEEEQIFAIQREFEEYYNVIFHEVQGNKMITDGLVEFVPRPFTKGTGIQETIKIMGIKWEDTIGVGDSNNDLEMLAYVHTPVCMGNGSAKAKELAKIITTHIDENGIEDGMKQLQLI